MIIPYKLDDLRYQKKEFSPEILLDITSNPELMSVKTAIEINVATIKKMSEIVEALPHDEIMDCYLHPADNRGNLEKLLLKNLYR